MLQIERVDEPKGMYKVVDETSYVCHCDDILLGGITGMTTDGTIFIDVDADDCRLDGEVLVIFP